jgi:hypothetical protein
MPYELARDYNDTALARLMEKLAGYWAASYP